MDRDTIAGEWMFSGMRDLLFAFFVEQRHPCFRYAVFHQIMALEKILKGCLLFAQADLYSGQPDQEVLRGADQLARRWGHDLRQLLRDVDREFAPWSSTATLSRTFDRLTGEQLIAACQAGYQETRYPTPSSVSSRFPTGISGLCHDPLNSTNTRDCIYELCREVLAQVKLRGGVEGLRQRVTQELLVEDIGKRFGRVFFAARPADFL